MERKRNEDKNPRVSEEERYASIITPLFQPRVLIHRVHIPCTHNPAQMLIVGIESLQTIQLSTTRCAHRVVSSFVYRVINVISAEPTTAVKSFDVCLVPARRVNETADKVRSKLEGEEEIEEIESLFTL